MGRVGARELACGPMSSSTTDVRRATTAGSEPVVAPEQSDGATPVARPPGRALRVGGHSYPLVLPKIRDPRLHVAAVVITIHTLGQVGLHFQVSVPQILAAVLTTAIIGVAVSFRATRTIVWPASAMLTGSGVALILRPDHAARRPLVHPQVVRVRRRRGLLAADEARHPVPRRPVVQPVQRRTGRRLPRPRRHPRSHSTSGGLRSTGG